MTKLRVSVLAAALSLLVLALTARVAGADQAEEGLLPVCAPSTSADPSWNPTTSDWHDHVSENTSVGPTDQYVGMGLAHDCAYQSYTTSELICEPGGCHRSDILEYHPLVAGYAFPDTFDAADGDHQRVTITMPGTAPYPSSNDPGVGWGACFPGFKWHEPLVLTGCDPGGWMYNSEENTMQPGVTDSFPYAGGAMVYRPRSPGGNFTGEWTASFGDASPGFHLQHVGPTPCTTTDSSCEYELDFTRDPTGQLQVTQDMQVVLELQATIPTGEGPHSATEAIPLLVIQTGGNGAPGGGSGSGDGSGSGSGGSGTGGGSSGAKGGGGAAGGGPLVGPAPPAPQTCSVPKVAKLTLAKAKAALAKAHCKLGAVRHASSAAVKKGLAIATSPPAGSKVATTKAVAVTISSGGKPGR